MRKQELFRTGDQALVRQINLSLVMHVLRRRAPISRASLSQAIGLNKSTVSDLVSALLERQFVRELGVKSSGIGRPGTLLTLNPRAGFIVSCEIGVDFIEVLVTDFAPEVIWQVQKPISPDIDQAICLRDVIDLLHQAVARGTSMGFTPLGVAVGVPGIVEQATGTLLFAPNLRWSNVPLKQLLEQQAFGVPVFVDNEANMAALGEHYFGAAQGFDEVLYISVGGGLGGGMIRDGQLCRGVSGGAAEFGHMTMDPEGELCNCGNRGCWETLVSQRALFRFVGELLAQGLPSLLVERTEGRLDRLSVPMVVDAAQVGDSVAIQSLSKLGRWLGIGIASLLNALNPDLVVFGGILSLAADVLLPIVGEEIQKRALRINCETVRVVRAAHGSDACVRGGVAMVYQSVLAQPNLIPLRNTADA
jgi:glucokinase-like ROK family protein